MDQYVGMGVLFLAILISNSFPSALGDPIIVLGDTSPSGLNSSNADDTAIQVHTVCQAIAGAEALGNEILLLTPSVTCGTKVYTGACGGKPCEASEMRTKIKLLASRIPAGQKQNLLIQTVGHGLPDRRSSWDEDRGPQNNDLGIGTGNLSAVEFAAILKSSGILGKVKTARGVWTQCYSGGWNELARLIAPPGKFCAISQAPHNSTADVGIDEYRIFGGSAFVEGFWKSQIATKGTANLQESTIHAAQYKKRATGDNSFSTKWNSSSRYLLEKATGTGNWYASQGAIDYASAPPKGYFSDGYNVDDLRTFQAFRQGTEKVEDRAAEINARNKIRIEEAADYNRDRWFFQSEQPLPKAGLIVNAVCTVNVTSPMTKAGHDVVLDIERMQEKMNQETYAKHRENIQAHLGRWKKEYQSAMADFPAEVKRYHIRNNELLLESSALMKVLNAEKLHFDQRKELREKYEKLEIKIRNLDRLEEFPKLREMLAVEKSIEHLEGMIQLIDDKNVAASTKESVLATWECENSPVFSGGSS